MTLSYQHSETFAKLKDVKEHIKVNLTSYQWLATLDHFIESAIDPIATAYPEYLDNYFAKVVAWQTTKPNVKFSRNAKEVLPVLLFNSLTSDGIKKREYQKAMLLNRGVLFGVINSYIRLTNSFMALHDPLNRMKRSPRMLAIKRTEELTSPHLYSATLQVRYWAAKAYWFKELIVQKYVRMTLMAAKRTYTDIKHRQKLDDVVQTYLVYLSRAIDRCDSRQGVLTTFIQTWFYSAKAEIQRGLAEEQHSSYEEMIENGLFVSATMPDCKYEALQHVAATAKKLDPEGVLRYACGIPEFLTAKQLRILSTHKVA